MATPAEGQAKPHDDAAVPIARRITKATRELPPLFRRMGASERMPMVGWFDPGQLASTGLKSIVSLLIGEQSDKRLTQALASRTQEYYDHSIHYIDRSQGPQPDKDRQRDSIWLDYICDTGRVHEPDVHRREETRVPPCSRSEQPHPLVPRGSNSLDSAVGPGRAEPTRMRAALEHCASLFDECARTALLIPGMGRAARNRATLANALLG